MCVYVQSDLSIWKNKDSDSQISAERERETRKKRDPFGHVSVFLCVFTSNELK